MPAAGDRSSARVWVVVVGWNNRALLEECFASVTAQTADGVRIVYVDNGSSDDSVAYVRREHPEVEVIEAGSNLGFAAGNNLGFERALTDSECTLVVALNTDARLTPDWVARIVAFAEAHPDAAGLQGATFNAKRRDELDSIGLYISRLGIPTQTGWRRSDLVPLDAEVFGVNAAACAYTRTFLERQPFGREYFDEDLFMYYEDVDISARALALGMRNYVVAGAVAYHIGSASTGELTPFKVRYGYRNLPLVMIKNLPARIALPMLLWRAALEPALFVFYLCARRADLARAMVSGRTQTLRLIPRFLGKRRQLVKAGRSHSAAVDYRTLIRPPADRGLVALELRRRLRPGRSMRST